MKHAPFCSDKSSPGERACACGKDRKCSTCNWATGVEHECDPEKRTDKVTMKDFGR